jgi:hypothetical protein
MPWYCIPVNKLTMPMRGVMCRSQRLLVGALGSTRARALCSPFVPARSAARRPACDRGIVWIEGTYEALPPGTWWPGLRPITVTFGEPVAPEDQQRRRQNSQPHQHMAIAVHDRVTTLGLVGAEQLLTLLTPCRREDEHDWRCATFTYNSRRRNHDEVDLATSSSIILIWTTFLLQT